jgi:hypothetical protein
MSTQSLRLDTMTAAQLDNLAQSISRLVEHHNTTGNSDATERNRILLDQIQRAKATT